MYKAIQLEMAPACKSSYTKHYICGTKTWFM